VRLALNHMVAPSLDHAAFFDLAKTLGVDAVEIRNDLEGIALADGTPADAIRQAASTHGLDILSINALQRFNQWNEARADEARQLAAYAKASGARALVLCPVNDVTFTPSQADRLAGLHEALRGLAPILTDAGLQGFVEPLGFAESSLRLKAEAVAAIGKTKTGDVFKLVHDTFHHFVAGETAFFPNETGLVHASGVSDATLTAGHMRDPHRVLVDASDRLDNIGQIRVLLQGGYGGPLSFEPFAASVHRSGQIASDLRSSLQFVEGGLRSAAAA
jgi:2-keto-myo-inositol isomerase